MNHNEQLIEKADHWIIPIVGREVTRCLADYAFSLEFWLPDDLITIRISGTFFLKTPKGETWLIPESHPDALGIALTTLHNKIESAIAYKTGKLKLEFTDNIFLSVDPDSQYEAWEINGTNGLKLVCRPDGNVAVWKPLI